MELRTERAAVTAAEPCGSILQEQGIELDHVLPDYYPDVCKLVKCFVKPTVLNESLNGDKLSYELRAEVRILYCSENSNILQCVTQTLLFSRTADLPAGEQVSVEILPSVDYINCRAVSRRRLDVRGAVTVRIRTCPTRTQEVLSDVSGRGIQMRRIPVQFPSRTVRAVQSIVLAEDLEIGSAQPALLHVVRCEARAVDLCGKLVQEKLMVQGNLRLQILYACERDGDGSLEPMTFTLPFSQILDVEGLDENDDCRLSCDTVSCDLKPAAEPNGDIRALRCEAELRVRCIAVRTASEQLVCDAFSTEHPCTCRTVELLTAGAPAAVSEMQVISAKLPCADEALDCVYDAWCDVRNLTSETGDAEIVLSGMLCWNVLVREAGGMPRLLEKEEPFEHRFAPGAVSRDDFLQITARAENCAYTLSGAEEVSLKAELRMEGTLTHCTKTTVLSGLEVQSESEHPRDYALKLYYGKAGEPVWDIAKRCHTSVDAVIEENDLTSDTLTESGMLLIPIIT